jgi:hypothetical protein
MASRNVQRRFGRLVKQVGLSKHCSMHTLWHSCGLLVVQRASRVAVMIDSLEKRKVRCSQSDGGYRQRAALFIVSDRGRHPGFARHESLAGGPGSLAKR